MEFIPCSVFSAIPVTLPNNLSTEANHPHLLWQQWCDWATTTDIFFLPVPQRSYSGWLSYFCGSPSPTTGNAIYNRLVPSRQRTPEINSWLQTYPTRKTQYWLRFLCRYTPATSLYSSTLYPSIEFSRTPSFGDSGKCHHPMATAHPLRCSNQAYLLWLPHWKISLDRESRACYPLAHSSNHLEALQSHRAMHPTEISSWMAPSPRLVPCAECIHRKLVPIMPSSSWNSWPFLCVSSPRVTADLERTTWILTPSSDPQFCQQYLLWDVHIWPIPRPSSSNESQFSSPPDWFGGIIFEASRTWLVAIILWMSNSFMGRTHTTAPSTA